MKPSHTSWSHCQCLKRLCECNPVAGDVCVHVLCLLTAGECSTAGRKSFHCVTCCLGLCHLYCEKLLHDATVTMFAAGHSLNLLQTTVAPPEAEQEGLVQSCKGFGLGNFSLLLLFYCFLK